MATNDSACCCWLLPLLPPPPPLLLLLPPPLKYPCGRSAAHIKSQGQTGTTKDKLMRSGISRGNQGQACTRRGNENTGNTTMGYRLPSHSLQAAAKQPPSCHQAAAALPLGCRQPSCRTQPQPPSASRHPAASSRKRPQATTRGHKQLHVATGNRK